MTGNYFEKLDALNNSEVFKCLNLMPKPVIHHFHLTAASPIKFLVDTLCYEDIVYYSQKEQNIKVTKCPEKVPEGYIKVNELRKYWSSAQEFDDHLRETILLIKGVDTQEHHEIWKYFQPKFMLSLGKLSLPFSYYTDAQ